MARARMTRPEAQAKTRADLLSAAAAVFKRRGYERAAIADIADEAGYSHGAVYSNFEGKDDLFLALDEKWVAERVAEIDATWAREGSLEDRARAAADEWIARLASEPWPFLLRLELDDSRSSRPQAPDKLATRVGAVPLAIQRLIESEMDDRGSSRPAATETALAFQALSLGLALEALSNPAAVRPGLGGDLAAPARNGGARADELREPSDIGGMEMLTLHNLEFSHYVEHAGRSTTRASRTCARPAMPTAAMRSSLRSSPAGVAPRSRSWSSTTARPWPRAAGSSPCSRSCTPSRRSTRPIRAPARACATSRRSSTRSSARRFGSLRWTRCSRTSSCSWTPSCPTSSPRQREAMLGYGDTMPAFVRKRFAIDESSVAHAYETFARIGELAQAELGEDGYFEGGRFGSADLALAAHVSPIVCPPQFPYAQPQRDHPLLERPRAALRDAGLFDWASRMYAQHRGTSAEVERA